MLPVESITDVVALFQHFDLDALLLSNKQLSGIAHQAAGKIRVFELSEFSFYVYSYDGINVLNVLGDKPARFVLSEQLGNDVDMNTFVSEAFRHCIVGDLAVLSSEGGVFSAIKEAASTVIVTGTLRLDLPQSATAQEVVDFVDTFHRVKVSAFALQELSKRARRACRISREKTGLSQRHIQNTF